MSSVPYDVVLATCNGSRFVGEQLHSLYSQSWPLRRLVVVDDASSDGTLGIVRELAGHFNFNCFIIEHSCRHGCAAAFAEGVAKSEAPYIFFCDQDDIWDDDHAEALLRRLLKLELNFGAIKPLLVYSDLRLIDSSGFSLGASFYRYQGLDPRRTTILDLALQNVVTGCAAVVNRACLKAALPMPSQAVLHDSWFALVAAGLGAIDYEPRATVSYRQHGQNVVGAPGFFSLICHRFWSFFSAAGRRRLVADLAAQLSQLRILLVRYGSQLDHRLPDSVACILHQLDMLGAPAFWSRLRAAWYLRLRKHGCMRTLAFYSLLCVYPIGRID